MKDKVTHPQAMDQENSLLENLRHIQREFKKNNSGPIVKLGTHYDTLKNTLLASSLSNTRNNIILYGLQGSGRKSAVNYAIKTIHDEKKQVIFPIWIDAGVFQTENEFALELARQINITCQNEEDANQISDISKSDIFENVFTFNNLTPYLDSKRGSWALVVDKIENLATQKRQSVLYAFLDWLLNNKNSLTLIGVTSDLKFTEKLEKRVKSRFTADEIHCMEYELEGCLDLIKSRLLGQQNKKNPNELRQKLASTFDLKEVRQFIELNIMNLMKPIGYMINLVHTMLCLIDDNCNLFLKIQYIYTQDLNTSKFLFYKQNSNKEYYCYDLLQQAYSLHQPPNGLNYVQTEPEKQVLICIKRMIENEKNPINLNTIISELSLHRKRYQYGTNQHFTLRVLQKATENLINLRMLRIQDNEDGDITGKLDETKNIILTINMGDFQSYLAENQTNLTSYLQDLAN